jgi:hypothetical protein
LKILGRKKLAEKLHIPAREDTTKNIQILTREDREKLIRGAISLQERLIIELLDATGGRRGELWTLRMFNGTNTARLSGWMAKQGPDAEESTTLWPETSESRSTITHAKTALTQPSWTFKTATEPKTKAHP